MRFIETPIFTREVLKLLKEDEYRNLQIVLLLRPEQGDPIPGTGGLRKIRWGAKGRGKRGGARVIYYWHLGEETFYMLLVYVKSRQEDLTSEQVRVLKRLVREEFK
jgi:mRNA-degrading endonuclease RelE of RelBE toxin-antitoxin system